MLALAAAVASSSATRVRERDDDSSLQVERALQELEEQIELISEDRERKREGGRGRR